MSDQPSSTSANMSITEKVVAIVVIGCFFGASIWLQHLSPTWVQALLAGAGWVLIVLWAVRWYFKRLPKSKQLDN